MGAGVISDDAYGIALLSLTLLLPVLALVARRMPLKRSALMALAWAGIILSVMLAIGLARDPRLQSGLSKLKGLLSDDEQHVSGRMVRLRMAPDGHFWATVSIDGVQRRMLIDSGATNTALSLATAKAAGLDIEQNAVPVAVSTANGQVFARTSSVKRLELGPIIATDLRVTIAPEFGETDVLGMNFLSRLKSWHVDGNMLVLEPES